MKTKKSFLILLGGYISILGFYFMWYFAKYNYLFFFRSYLKYFLAEIAVVVLGITILFYFLFLFISFIRPLKKPWPCFSLVSIITLSTLLLIPSNYYAKYHENYFNWVKQKRIERAKKKRRQRENLKKEMETKLNNPIETNDAASRTIAKPQARLKTESEENDKRRKQSKEVIRESRSKNETISALRSKLKEEHETKGDVVVKAKSNKDFSKIKIDSEVNHTELDTKNQEIIFKVQIISSSTRLAKNSPQFMGIKNVWEYKHSGLYKYTVGNQKDLKSASALQSKFRRKGFNGAFVVTFKNGKRIPVKEALRLLN
jgi:hypothetical protein